MLVAALVGFLAAFVASMPVAGPVSALVVRHALHGEARAAILLSIGAGLAEAAYAWLALWGFSTFLSDYPWVVPVSKIVAGLILVVLGIVFTRYVARDESAAVAAADPAHPSPIGHAKTAVLSKERPGRPWSSFTVGFGVTALNPTLLATWSAAATTLFSANLFKVEPAMAWPFALGVCVGAVAWFSILTAVLYRFRHKFNRRILQRIIRGMGWGLVGLGLFFLGTFAVWATS